MNFFGYNIIFSEEEDDETMRLREIQIIATPRSLKKIGQFFLDMANEMDQLGDVFEHRHLQDEIKEFAGWEKPDIVLHRKASEAQ